ncbi:Putative methylated-DNA--protein-cysteine methyltransferase [Acromyrmex echinatior]|uniref:Methylated-DNA--protein-cysteine methyltransferase n=1 Tax=Acromyrmex echinatior TaxID=103372 RepID=F4WP62_ACREC|nr:Putative methylated-DNA--protein-cysteine methyltransferase [Acromyrmex echinatior]
MVVFRSITVDEYKSNYMTFQLLYACHRTPIGKCLIAITDTDESVTYLKFIDNEYDGTKFQIKIWRSLTEIPGGTVTTYGEVARMAGCDSKTAIAVGNACSRNYVAYIVPCHRVVAKNTHVCGIKNAWKIEQKGTILEYEKQLYA